LEPEPVRAPELELEPAPDSDLGFELPLVEEFWVPEVVDDFVFSAVS